MKTPTPTPSYDDKSGNKIGRVDNPIKRISEDKSEKKLDKTTLDYSKPEFNLVSIDELDDTNFIKEYKNLLDLNISNNSIPMLSLKGYNKLETIMANNNLIIKVELNLNKLTKLSLSNNLIKTIFDLNSTPALKELNLSENSITTVTYENFRPVKNCLESLYLNQNKIDFTDSNQFMEFVKLFGKNMKSLIRFSIIGNPFCDKKSFKDYATFFVTNIQKVELFNNKAVLLSDKKSEMVLINLERKMRAMEETQKKVTPGGTDYGASNLDDNFATAKEEITLSDVVKKITKLTTMGKLTISTLQELKSLINQYIYKKKNDNKDNKDNIEDTELNDFDNFLELANILIDTSPMLEKHIYFLVCDFINTKNGKFSGRILSYLKQRIFSDKSDELQTEIMGHLAKKMDFDKKMIETINPSLIIGMEPLLSNPVLSELPTFLNLTDKLIQFIINIKNIKLLNCRLSEEIKKRDIYFSTVIYLNTASNLKTHFNLMIKNFPFLDELSNHVKKVLSENFESLILDEIAMTTFTKLLDIMKKLFNLRSVFVKIKINKNTNKPEIDDTYKNLQKLLGGGLRDKIEQALNLRFQDMAKKNSSEKDFNINKNKIFCSLIRGYGALLYLSEDVYKHFKDPKSTVYKILSLLVQSEHFDPFIIYSACECILNMLENEQIKGLPKGKKTEEELFKLIIKSLYGLRYVLPYLVYDKPEYKFACLRAEKYGQTTIVRGKPVEFSSLNAELMHNLIISIVRLIEYFGRNSKIESNISEACKTFCKELQDQNKNIILCNCLIVPNEKVKKAIVESLYSMDCTSFASEEVTALSKQLYDVSLSGDHIESILSTIFIIFDQCFQNFILKKEIERIKQNKEIFNLALEILLKNNDRNIVMESDYKKKVMLNCAISAFLINCCRKELINVYFNDKFKSKKLCEILQMEEKNIFSLNSSLNVYYVPIDCEKIRSGFKIENLMALFSNENYITPFTFISSRVMMHIADVLMNIKPKSYDMDFSLELDILMKELKNKFSEREYKRVLVESLTFKKFMDYVKTADRSLFAETKDPKANELRAQQKMFLDKFDVFMTYIKGQTNNKINLKFSVIWTAKLDKNLDEFDNHFDNPDELEEKNRIFYDEYLEDQKLKGLYNSDMFKDNENINRDFIMNLRKEQYLKIGDDDMNNGDVIKGDIEVSELYYSKKNLVIVRKAIEEDPNNPYIRGLFISGFLRAIYALLEFPVDMEIKDLMIEKFCKYLKDIAKLVEICITGEFNVPSKFIRIIKYILLKPKDENIKGNINKITIDNENTGTMNNETPESELNDEKNSKYIAYIIKKLISKVKDSLTVEKDNDKILLYELCQCCAIMCNKLNYSHPEITKINASYNQIEKKYILNRKMHNYITFDVVNLFILKIIEYMEKEATLYIAEPEEEKKKVPSEEKKEEEEDEEENNGEGENEQKEDEYGELEAAIQKSNDIKMLDLLIGETNFDKNIKRKFSIDDILIDLTSAIPLFLSEYMAKCTDEEVYEVFEQFIRYNVFNGVEIRKSYLKEIIDLMNLSKKRKLLSRKFTTNFMTRVYVTNYDNKKTLCYLMSVTDYDLKFFEIDEYVEEKNDIIEHALLETENKDENILFEKIDNNFQNNENLTINYEKIHSIYCFEIKNRILLKLKYENTFIYKMFFFRKYFITKIILDYIKLNNCNVEIIEDIPIFLSEEELLKQEAHDVIKRNVGKFSEKNNKIIINDTNKGVLDENKLKENEKNAEDLKEEKIEVEIKQLEDNKNHNMVLFCNVPIRGFFDFIIKFFVPEKEGEVQINPKNNRVLKIKGNEMEIYDELEGEIPYINTDVFNYSKEIISFAEISKEMKKCYSYYYKYDLNDLESIEFRLNTLKIKIGTTSELDINCFDDFTLVKLKNCFFNYFKTKGKIDNKENYKFIE